MYKLIGLTGGIGMGKSTLSKSLKDAGFGVIDCDQITHNLYEYSIKFNVDIINAFNDKYRVKISTDNNIWVDRKKLAQFLFTGIVDEIQEIQEKLGVLQNTCFPYIMSDILEWLKFYNERNDTDVVVLDAPLLFEMKLDQLLPQYYKKNYESWVVYCTEQTQIKRIKERNPDWSPQEIQNRINVQLPIKEKCNAADVIFNNESGKTQLLHQINYQVNRVLEEVQELKKKEEQK